MAAAKDKQYELGLKLPTDPRWADLAQHHLADILIDHAYCEQKAASSCISLIVSFPQLEEVVRVLAPIVTEEWGHFRQVLAHMEKRGIRLGPKRNDEYVLALGRLERKGGSKAAQLMEKCLINALIEARSCERFKRLWQYLGEEDELGRFYYQLMVSEAGHYRTFLELAEAYNPTEAVRQRWQEYLSAEASIIEGLQPRADRFH
ncbi:MAG: tRNA-(ms[2]io[6]A)-hydroxylase [Cytophagales bacterium]|nr:tRNA-(ms[2]io[6]A)-hydroxylase [Cytophagales bacterium]